MATVIAGQARVLLAMLKAKCINCHLIGRRCEWEARFAELRERCAKELPGLPLLYLTDLSWLAEASYDAPNTGPIYGGLDELSAELAMIEAAALTSADAVTPASVAEDVTIRRGPASPVALTEQLRLRKKRKSKKEIEDLEPSAVSWLSTCGRNKSKNRT